MFQNMNLRLGFLLVVSRQWSILRNNYESQDIIYILFSIFYYCQKICKDVEKENHGNNGNKGFIWYQQKKRS